MIDSVAGETRAAPTPCTVRAAIRTALEPASPHTSDAAVKTARPVMKISLRPSRSAKRPPSSRKPPKVIVYAVITHCRPLEEKWSAREIDGSATVTSSSDLSPISDPERLDDELCSGAARILLLPGNEEPVADGERLESTVDD